mgnify:CR=1 FL=1
MRSVILLLIGLLPAVAAAQVPGDTVDVVVPEDRNCGNFASQQDAQGWYDAVALITGQPDAHGLDSDGDGQPYEGLTYGKVEHVGDGYLIRYKLVPWEVECPTVQESFTIAEYKDVAQTAVRDSVGYLAGGGVGIWSAMDCLHSLGSLRQEQ